MTTMLSVLAPAPARLADVMPSCLAALLGHSNPLLLASVDHAVVVLIDGLGLSALSARAGHARFLTASATDAWARTAFPSTTAANLTTLTTGQPPGQHGLVGYSVRDAGNDRIVNQLTGWDADMVPETWQRSETVFEKAIQKGIDAIAVGARRYAGSGFTRAVLRGARYDAVSTISEGVDAIGRHTQSSQRKSLLYLYVPELDIAAHAAGLDSGRWIAELEAIDAEICRLASIVGPNTGILITADHGIVDVPRDRHVHINESPNLMRGVHQIGGEPRCVHLYAEEGFSVDDLAARWRESEGARSWIFSRSEAISLGLFGDVHHTVASRIGDVLVFPHADVAYYDALRASPGSFAMIGQHGSATDAETRVPLIGVGAFATLSALKSSFSRS